MNCLAVVAKRFMFLLLVISLLEVWSQDAWKGKKAAVVITYDDAIDQHLNNAVPLLDSLGLKASFYITAASQSVARRLSEWKGLAGRGHELGNHSLFHPCIGKLTGREWVSKEYDMSEYSIKKMEDELRMTNTFLQALDGKTRRTFAFTCGDQKIGDSAFLNGMRMDFVAARAARNQMHTIDQVDIYNMDCYVVNHHSASEMKAWVDAAIRTQSLLVILFHGVGGGNGLDVTIDNHRQLLRYLKEKEKEIWVAPLIEVADYIKGYKPSH